MCAENRRVVTIISAPMRSATPTSLRIHLARVASLFFIALVVTLVVGFGPASQVAAHSFLVRTSPASGARLTTGPDEIVLDFSEPIDGTPEITLRTSAGRTIALPFVGAEADNVRVRANVPALGRDVFIVTWRVLARDGHTSEGEYAFAVGADLPTGTTGTAIELSSGPFAWVDTITQFGLAGGLAFALGGLLSERFIWRDQNSGRSSPRSAAPRSPAALAIAIALGGIFSSVAIELHRRQVLLAPAGWSNVLDTRANRVLLAMGGVSWLGLAAARSKRLRPAAFVPVAAALGLLVWRGHSGDDGRWWATPVGAAHVIGGGIWAGALLHLNRFTKAPDEDAIPAVAVAANRYSRVVLIIVLATIGSGTVVAVTRFTQLDDLWTTRYGRVLVVKLVLVTAALLLANLARRQGLPAVGSRLAALRNITRIEVIVLAIVIAASVVLANTGPPVVASSFLLGPPPLTNATWGADLAGNNLVLVAAVDRQLQVRILQPGGQPPAKARSTIAGRQPDGGDIDIFARSCGPGCEVVGHDWQDGTTELEITVPEGEYAGGTAVVAIDWPPGPDASPLLTAAVAATKSAPRLTLSESVTSDPSIRADPATTEISGTDFISQEPFANGGDDVHQLADENGLNRITFTVPASNIWVKMWIDPQSKRIVKETIIDPGHRIEHILTYSP